MSWKKIEQRQKSRSLLSTMNFGNCRLQQEGTSPVLIDSDTGSHPIQFKAPWYST